MVSVKRCTLPDSYIDAAHKLIEALKLDYKIDYAFWYLKYSDNEEWYQGDWQLIIATNGLRHNFEGISVIFNMIETLKINIDEFKYSFAIIEPNLNDYTYYYLDKIIIKRLGEE